MTATSASPSHRVVARASARTKVVAVLIVVALAALALYAVFAPPTTVSLNTGTGARTTPANTAPTSPTGEPDEDRGEGGD